MPRLPPGGQEVTVEVGHIAAGRGQVEQRADALLDVLRRLVPYQAAGIYLLDPERRAHLPVAFRGYDRPVYEYLTSPACTDALDAVGLTRTRKALRVRDVPVPRSELRGWTDYLYPAGFREGLGVGLFTVDGRHLGTLVLNTDTDRHPTAAARDLIGTMAPTIANAVDPLRSMSRVAGIVDNAEAGVVLTRAGATVPLPGMPTHPLLADASDVVHVAAERLAAGEVYSTFLCPYVDNGAADCHVLITVLACPPHPPHYLHGIVLISPTGDLCGLSRRELEILGLIVEGWPNHRIAAAMALAQRTVNTHLEHLLAKLGTPTRTAAAVHALRYGCYVPRPLNGIPK